MSEIQVKVPDIGDFKDVAVIEVLVQPGDTVKVEQSLITVESDKASMEIPSSHAGVVKSLAVKLGDTVNEGSVVLTLEVSAAGSTPSPAGAGEGGGEGGCAWGKRRNRQGRWLAAFHQPAGAGTRAMKRQARCAGLIYS